MSDFLIGAERASVAKAVAIQHYEDKMSQFVACQDNRIQTKNRMHDLITKQGFVICRGGYKRVGSKNSEPTECYFRLAPLTKRVFTVEYVHGDGDAFQTVFYYGLIADIGKPTFDLYSTATAEGNKPTFAVIAEANKWLCKPYHAERFETIDQASGKWTVQSKWTPRGFWALRMMDTNKITKFFGGLDVYHQ